MQRRPPTEPTFKSVVSTAPMALRLLVSAWQPTALEAPGGVLIGEQVAMTLDLKFVKKS